MINIWHLLWIAPLFAVGGYTFHVILSSEVQRYKDEACMRCWAKWNYGIHPKNPGIENIRG